MRSTPTDGPKGGCLWDTLNGAYVPHRGAPNVAAMAPDDSVSEALRHLSERDQDIVRLRFGLNDGKAWTCDEVAGKYGVTGERIRQIEAKAMAKLRRLDGAH